MLHFGIATIVTYHAYQGRGVMSINQRVTTTYTYHITRDVTEVV